MLEIIIQPAIIIAVVGFAIYGFSVAYEPITKYLKKHIREIFICSIISFYILSVADWWTAAIIPGIIIGIIIVHWFPKKIK